MDLKDSVLGLSSDFYGLLEDVNIFALESLLTFVLFSVSVHRKDHLEAMARWVSCSVKYCKSHSAAPRVKAF